jgi:hypothetical protein
LQVSICEIKDSAVFSQPADSEMVPARAIGVPVYRFV